MRGISVSQSGDRSGGKKGKCLNKCAFGRCGVQTAFLKSCHLWSRGHSSKLTMLVIYDAVKPVPRLVRVTMDFAVGRVMRAIMRCLYGSAVSLVYSRYDKSFVATLTMAMLEPENQRFSGKTALSYEAVRSPGPDCPVLLQCCNITMHCGAHHNVAALHFKCFTFYYIILIMTTAEVNLD